jgi:acid phosphatase
VHLSETATASASPQFTAVAAGPGVSSATSIPIADGLSTDSFKLPLTIQHVTDTSAELYFELAQPTDGILVYQATQASTGEQSTPFDASTAVHQITLSNLAPGTQYQALVVLKDTTGHYHQPAFTNAAWGNVTFHTSSDKQPLRVGMIGDSGFGDSVTPQLANQMADSSLDFAIQLGDIVYNVSENADPFEAFALKYYRPFSPMLHQMPVYPVVGNHDVERATLWNRVPFFYHAFPDFSDPRFEPSTYNKHNEWYAFAYGSVQFIILNTEAFYDAQSRKAQNAWLATRLLDKRFTTSIPVFHIPPYTGGLHVSDGLVERSDWQPLFEQIGVRLVLSGHDHNYQRLLVNGITYIVSGGGSATLYAQTIALPQSQVFVRRSHFVILEIYPDRIDLKSIALGGDILDQVSIALH